MTKETLFIPNISCGHCVMSIKNELSELEGVRTVEGDSGNKSITVEFESPVTLEQIKETLKEINYPAVQLGEYIMISDSIDPFENRPVQKQGPLPSMDPVAMSQNPRTILPKIKAKSAVNTVIVMHFFD